METKYARIGVVGILFRGDKVLAIQRSASVAAPLTWCFPGGGIEAGETQEQALVREFQEELGIQIRPLTHLLDSVTPWNVFLSWWTVEADDSELSRLNADPREVRQTVWLTLAELKNHPNTLESNIPIIEWLEQHQPPLVS